MGTVNIVNFLGIEETNLISLSCQKLKWATIHVKNGTHATNNEILRFPGCSFCLFFNSELKNNECWPLHFPFPDCNCFHFNV